jgi:hypothetical protein
MRFKPQAMFVETKWVAGLSSKWPSAGIYLNRKMGYNFPILSKIKQRKVVLAYSAIFRDSFDPELTTIGLVTKALSGLVYAASVGNTTLVDESRHLAVLRAERDNLPLDQFTLDEVAKIAREDPPTTSEACSLLMERLMVLPGIPSRKAAAIVVLARSCCARPTVVTPCVVQDISCLLDSSERVEAIMWVGLQQCFHRVIRFAEANDGFLNRRGVEKELQAVFFQAGVEKETGKNVPEEKNVPHKARSSGRG